ncbi:MAG: bifunctional 4-hydroxy-2-oxoglutarate aldolase/2-dehydro-3-deoxy-phosphogluconate aldolase [Spirochaetota bacterium]
MESKVMDGNIVRKIWEARIIGVLVFERHEEVAPTIEALLEGGVNSIELALRSPYALSAVERVKREYPQMLLGVGTVLTPEQVKQIAPVADFAVAPGLNRRVIEAASREGLPFYPGISTASELEAALEYDIRLLKFFPAEPLGGLGYLQSMNTPYAHLDLRYIPLGGVNPQNLGAYLQSPLIGAVGGSWIAPRKLIASGAWGNIREQAAAAMATAKNVQTPQS